jgi:MSHA pilin protein MshA
VRAHPSPTLDGVSRRSPRFSRRPAAATGFTIIELVVVIILLGILAALALPRFVNLSDTARLASLESLAGTMRSTIALAQAQARAEGLVPILVNPGAGQTAYIIETEAGSSELDFRNLCPESSAELGDALDMADYMRLSLTDDMTITVDNQFTRIGYDITGNTSSGCYVLYDSFGNPDCTVTVVSADC